MTAPIPSNAVELDQVSVERGGRLALDGVTASVPTGTIVGLIGPSGCGKSTLMRTVVGVQANVTGSVRVLGGRPERATARGAVGYMTQEASVYEDLSVAENLDYFGQLVDALPSRRHEILELVRLTDHATARVDRLSGGQRARVSLAAALLNDPPLLVLDEPTVGLDPVLRAELWNDFDALRAQGSTLLVSSHVMDEAERCDTLLLMRAGRVLASGTPTDLKASTGTTTVEAAFLSLVEGDDRP